MKSESYFSLPLGCDRSCSQGRILGAVATSAIGRRSWEWRWCPGPGRKSAGRQRGCYSRTHTQVNAIPSVVTKAYYRLHNVWFGYESRSAGVCNDIFHCTIKNASNQSIFWTFEYLNTFLLFCIDLLGKQRSHHLLGVRPPVTRRVLYLVVRQQTEAADQEESRSNQDLRDRSVPALSTTTIQMLSGVSHHFWFVLNYACQLLLVCYSVALHADIFCLEGAIYLLSSLIS